MNSIQKKALNHISQEMSSPLESLSIQDIEVIQSYLEKLKKKKLQLHSQLHSNPTYKNPYECGSKQNSFQPLIQDSFPSHIRNINVESDLMQQFSTHLPGQKKELFNQHRFDYLPFNPQDPNHLVWIDNMPRGGYATRTAREEI